MNLSARLGRGREKAKAPEGTLGDAAGVRTGVSEKAGMVTVDLDSFTPESHKELREETIRRSGFPLFKGSVTHGYSKSFTGGTDTCPRCQAPTRQESANFIYATDTAPRAMLAPAGFFCTACPTAIVDEPMVAACMKAGYRFRRVVGIDYFGEKNPDYFGTWNGEKPLYVLDEDGQIMDMTVDSDLCVPSISSLRPAPVSRRKAKAKRKQAAKARRRNRRK